MSTKESEVRVTLSFALPASLAMPASVAFVQTLQGLGMQPEACAELSGTRQGTALSQLSQKREEECENARRRRRNADAVRSERAISLFEFPDTFAQRFSGLAASAFGYKTADG